MRVIRYVILSFLALGLLAGALFVVTREALLTWSVWKVKDALVTLRTAGANPDRYADNCKQFAANNSTLNKVKQLELAFTDDRHFQFQVICDQFVYQPLVVSTFELGPLVTKTPGSAGFVWSKSTPTMVTLQLWGRSQSIVLNAKDTTISQGKALINSALSPQGACKAYGYQCCAADSTKGVGDVATSASDCPQTCFAQCVALPVVLSFNTQPFFDPKTRSLSIEAGQEVGFNYTTNVPVSQVKNVIIDFGDNQSYHSASPSGTIGHQYSCAGPQCEYQAHFTITNTQDLSNAQTPVSQVKIQVRP